MTARERALALHWEVDPKPEPERNPAGVKIHKLIRGMNVQALIASAKERERLEKLRRSGDL